MKFNCLIGLISLIVIDSLLGAQKEEFNSTLAKKFWNFEKISCCTISNILSLQCGPDCTSYQKEFQYLEIAFNESTNMLAWMGYSTIDDVIYITFRGTLGIVNWLHDFDFFQVSYPEEQNSFPYPPQNITCQDCKVHNGFYTAYISIRDQIMIALNSISKRSGCSKVFVVGYSLGGAMATHNVLDLLLTQKQFQTNWIYTFGCPRVGNREFAQFFNEIVPTAYRITHFKDIVPHAPIENMGFYHTDKEVWYNSDSDLNYIICNDGEDQKCSDSEKVDNVFDHLHYMNQYVGDMLVYCSANSTQSIVGDLLKQRIYQ